MCDKMFERKECGGMQAIDIRVSLKTAFFLLVPAVVPLIISNSGCVAMPSLASIPKDTHPQVRKSIEDLYWGDVYKKEDACRELRHLATDEETFDEICLAIPFLLPLLADRSVAWYPSVFIPYTGIELSMSVKETIVVIGKPAVPGLIERLKSKDSYLLLNAIDCLGKIADPRSIEPLLPLTQVYLDSRQCLAAKMALARISDVRCIPFMAEVFGLASREFLYYRENVWAIRSALAAAGRLGLQAESLVDSIKYVMMVAKYHQAVLSDEGKYIPTLAQNVLAEIMADKKAFVHGLSASQPTATSGPAMRLK